VHDTRLGAEHPVIIGNEQTAIDPVLEARIHEQLERLGPLPVLDRTVRRICALADDSESSATELTAAIEHDESFAANLLRFANSAALARPVRARTIRHALTMVGRRRLGQIALETATYRYLERVPGGGRASRGQLHAHAVAVATCAAATAERSGASVETAHLAGLLHDIGKIVLPLVFGEEAVELIALEYPGGAQRAARERVVLGIDHAYVGALYASRSEVTDDVFDAIAAHHGGVTGTEVPSAEAACVQLADQVVGMIAGAEPDVELVQAALALLGLPESALDELAQDAAPQAARPLSPLAERVQELERIAFVDALTGIGSRRAWLDDVERRLAAGATGAVLICDVDHLKLINDTHGHATGDVVLIETARALASRGFAGRLGGDEFALWVDGGVRDAQAVADAIVQAVITSITAVGSVPVPASVSIGIAVTPHHGTAVSELLAIADAALYDAKAAGRRSARLAA
jgi:diguanylate cyclase (GGDEF)-like protein/putative nucleotidyltransferase with HDIG domain